MNLGEFIDELLGRKKKPRKLVDIDVDEITLCESAANRKTFFITKGRKMDEFFKAIKLFLDGEIGKATISGTELKKAMETLLAYKSDFPEDIKSALDVILKSAFLSSSERSRDDDFPSIPIVGPAHLIDKMADTFEDGEEADDDEPIDEWG